MAGISFTLANGCTTASTLPSCYVAHVAWTGDSKTRACGSTQTAVANGLAPSPTTLPTALFTPVATQTNGVYSAPPPVIVVDATYTYTPRVFGALIGAITISRAAYFNPRYMTELEYQAVTGDDGFGKLCTGGY